MIGPAPVLGSMLGTDAPKTNNCNMRTSGWELEIGWRDQIQDFKYGVRFNLSDNKSKIISYPFDGEFGNQGIYGYYNGKELGELWGYTSVGLAQSDEEMKEWLTSNKPNWGSKWQAGDVKYKDLTGEGEVTPGASTLENHGDLKRIGNNSPRYRVGLNLDAAWKGIDFSIFFQGVLKRDWMFDAGDPYFWGAGSGMWQAACFEEHMDYWTPENTDAYYPKPYFNETKNQQAQDAICRKLLTYAARTSSWVTPCRHTLPKKPASATAVSIFHATICLPLPDCQASMTRRHSEVTTATEPVVKLTPCSVPFCWCKFEFLNLLTEDYYEIKYKKRRRFPFVGRDIVDGYILQRFA